MRKLESVSLTEIGRLLGRDGTNGRDEDESTLAFDSEESAMLQTER